MSQEILSEIRSHEVDSPNDLIHLQHVFEGYRTRIAWGPGYDCGYSPGSAREISFRTGVKWAERDMVAAIPAELIIPGHPETAGRELDFSRFSRDEFDAFCSAVVSSPKSS